MTLSNNYQPTKVSANGSLVDFGFAWNGLNENYIRVYLEDKTTGNQTLIDPSEYTITEFNQAGGNVRFNTAPAATNFVIISRDVDETQETPYKTSLGFNGEDVEASFDKLTAKVQELTEISDRSPKLPIGSDIDAQFPIPVPGNLIEGAPDGNGWIDSGVSAADLRQDAQDAADSADAAAQSASDAAASATAASGFADDAEESAERAKDKFKGEWDENYIDPISGLAGYIIGDTVLFNNNQWESRSNQNTAEPPFDSSTPSAEWKLFLPGAESDDKFVASTQEAKFAGNGVKTDFNITDNNGAFKPTTATQIYGVFIDTDPVSREEYSIFVDGNGDSFIRFNTAPPAIVDPDGTYNILVIGATPKSIPDLEDAIGINLPINQTILNNNAVTAHTVTWQGSARSDNNTTNIISSTPIESPALTGKVSDSTHYLFVGLDNTSNTILEWATDLSGSSLVNIVGAKRMILPATVDSSGNIYQDNYICMGNEINVFPTTTRDFHITESSFDSTVQIPVPNYEKLISEIYTTMWTRLGGIAQSNIYNNDKSVEYTDALQASITDQNRRVSNTFNVDDKILAIRLTVYIGSATNYTALNSYKMHI